MQQIRYYSLNKYFKEKFGERVLRIPVDAGFTCPNRNGTKGYSGCIYCDEIGSGARYIKRGKDLIEQVTEGISRIKQRFKVNKYLVYFQPFTNTYSSVEKLKELYYSVTDIDNVVGISIGTRPDCIDHRKIDLLSEIAKSKEVWIEYGLQSIHNKTLELINRGHNYKDFLDAIEITKNRGIKILAHIIVGLPGENREDILSTANEVANLKLDGIKIHSLYIVKGTALEEIYRKKENDIMEKEEYIQLVADILELLPPDMVIHRLTGECEKNRLVAPDWVLNKNKIIQSINKELAKRGSKQGQKYKQYL